MKASRAFSNAFFNTQHGRIAHGSSIGLKQETMAKSGSVRRTSHIDLLPHAGLMRDGFAMRGGARDLRTDLDGSTTLLDEATVEADVDANATATRLATDPARVDTSSFVGQSISRGFRARLDAVAPDERDAHTPLFLLLDEVPIAAAMYFDDMYVDSGLQLETAGRVGNVRTWVTNEYEHDGLRADGPRVLGRLFDMRAGRV